MKDMPTCLLANSFRCSFVTPNYLAETSYKILVAKEKGIKMSVHKRCYGTYQNGWESSEGKATEKNYSDFKKEFIDFT